METEAQSIFVTYLMPRFQEVAVPGPGLWFSSTQPPRASLCSFLAGWTQQAGTPALALPILWPWDLLYPVGDCTALWTH